MTNPTDKLAVWQHLVSEAGADLLRAVRGKPQIGPRDLKRWRERFGVEETAAALDLLNARRKAKRKFPERRDLLADPQGVEQATSALVAGHKAKRFAALGPARIHDLCCGIGGDAMSLAKMAPVVAVDASPLRAWMAGVNADCESLCADVTALELRDEVFHLDPARREESADRRRRMHRFGDYQPGPDFIEDLLRRCPSGAIKLGPGVDFAELPSPDSTELELISERGTLVQAVLWTGDLAQRPGERTATCLPAGASFTAHPRPLAEPQEPGRYLYAVDPALERGGLMGAFVEHLRAAHISVGVVHEKLGLLTTSDRLEQPLLTGFELHRQMPYRQPKVKAALAELGAGEVEVKTRGGAVNPDEAQLALRGQGSKRMTVFILRLGQQKRAYLCTRLAR
jgi:THUMP domain-like